jgi:hypothetical protein
VYKLAILREKVALFMMTFGEQYACTYEQLTLFEVTTQNAYEGEVKQSKWEGEQAKGGKRNNSRTRCLHICVPYM